jgi:hypothetical protein
MTQLPGNYRFSQGSLQDFTDCRRRFYYRDLQRLAWPALEAEPALENERLMRQGARFHHMVNQHLNGIPAEAIHPRHGDMELASWWENYLSDQPADVDGELYPEVTLQMPFEGYRLIARYDLVVVTPDGQAMIFDWKTSRSQPSRSWLESRLQTRVYPFVLAGAGASLNSGQPIDPSRIEMVYWYATSPETPVHFPYSQAMLEEDRRLLAGTIEEIAGLRGADDFPLTDDERRCRYCVYRSLDDRGVQAGEIADFIDPAEEEQEDLTVDFDQIAEIEF